MIVDDRWLAICQGMVSFLSGNSDVATRGFKRIALDWSLVKHPRYPAQPLAECPFVVLRAEGCVQKKLPSAGLVWEQTAGLWIYRSKPLSDEGQADLMMDLQVLSGVINSSRNPTPLCVAGAESSDIPGKLVHDEMHHKYDDPRLRVLVGEIALSFIARRS